MKTRLSSAKALEIDPNLLLAIHFMAMCARSKGALLKRSPLSSAPSRCPTGRRSIWGSWAIYARAGEREKVDALIAELELSPIGNTCPRTAWSTSTRA